MVTTARVWIEQEEGVKHQFFKRVDGYPEAVLPDIRAWLEAMTDLPFSEWVEYQRKQATEYSVYQPVYFTGDEDDDYGVPFKTRFADHEFTVTVDGRIFGGREL